MNENWNVEENYELFKGDLRRLDELIAQLEIWRDEKTINHKKEQVRLEEYVELSKNLYELQEELDRTITCQIALEETAQLAAQHKLEVEEKFNAFKETEQDIHEWIRAIKEIEVIVMKSPTLQEYREVIEKIINDNL